MLAMKKFRIWFSILSIALALPLYCIGNSPFGEPKFAVAISYTPVLNTSDFESVFGGSNGTSVKLDSKGLIREMEFIAFPETVFEIEETIQKNGYEIYKIKTSDYPYNSSELFIDSRFVQTFDSMPVERKQVIPSKEEIIEKLNKLEGYGYMWGGNYGDGIAQLLEYYKPASEIPDNEKALWCLKGVDCSGLIYQATNGATPRNTSSLTDYGEGKDIQGKSFSEIASILAPLDLIVWNGHVIIVLDENTTIESTPDAGVHKSDLRSRLRRVMNERTPVNDWDTTKGKRFVVRKWVQ